MTDHERTTVENAARDAWLYGLPLIECATARSTALRAGGRINTVTHVRTPQNARTERVTASNNDVLMSRAWLDLSAGPATLSVPAAGSRYLSVALMDMYTNNFAILGTRASEGRPGIYRIVGPDNELKGDDVIVSPTRSVWALVRTLVENEVDAPAARALQNSVQFDGPDVPQSGEDYGTRTASWQDYFATVSRLMQYNPPPIEDAPFLKRLFLAGVDLADFKADRYSLAQATAIEEGVKAAHRWLERPGVHGSVADGWFYPPTNIGNYGTDYPYRALVALVGLAALPPNEAIYLSALAPDNTREFDGGADWALRLPAGQLPPVDGFWSMTLYRKTSDGQFFMYENDLDRHSIGDRTPNLLRDGDGGMTIHISHTRPTGPAHANWLPSPSAGKFILTLRCYLPRGELLGGKYHLPRVVCE